MGLELKALPVGTLTATYYIIVTIDILAYALRLYALRGTPYTRGRMIGDALLGFAIAWLLFALGAWTWMTRRAAHYRDHPPTDQFIVPGFEVTFGEAVVIQKLKIAHIYGFYTGCWCAKGALIINYFDFKRHLTRRMKWWLYALAALVVSTYASNIILDGVWCRPISRAWALGKPEYCIHSQSKFLIIWGASTNIFTDICLIIYPSIVLSSLKLRRSQIMAILFIVFIGLISMTASGIHLGILVTLADILGEAHTDPRTIAVFWQNTTLVGGFEQTSAVFAACLPALKVFFTGRAGTMGAAAGAGNAASSSWRWSARGRPVVAKSFAVTNSRPSVSSRATDSQVWLHDAEMQAIHHEVREVKTQSGLRNVIDAC